MTPTLRLAAIALTAATAIAGVATVVFAPAPATTDAAESDQMTFFARSTVLGDDIPEPTGVVRPDPGTTLTGLGWTWATPSVNSVACVAFTAQSDAPAGWGVELTINAAPIWGGSIWSEIGDVHESDDGFDVRFWPGTPTAAPTAVRLCTSGANPPVDPSLFTTAQSATEWGPDTRACFNVTVASTEHIDEYPFFFGWSAPVDLRDAAAMFQERGAHPTHVEFAHQGEWFTASPVDLVNGMTITSTMAGSIRGIGSGVESRDIRTCLVGW
ncbi:hypothetical protein [Agromyces larvae]|uniref:Uncharacterized protein n=1 Tax=Agromyces larvae TaxID=2929802 RepID=A0ABY4C3E2_9MICO|nr:hypothetical protein [Agromyces larvae]UOE44942.1 hypothetical protein MTO99_03945 [Agromyces larvae]